MAAAPYDPSPPDYGKLKVPTPLSPPPPPPPPPSPRPLQTSKGYLLFLRVLYEGPSSSGPSLAYFTREHGM